MSSSSKILRHPPSFAAVAAAALASSVTLLAVSPAFAGSIVINASAPNTALQYKDDNGTVKDLVVTWSDLQLISKVKGFLIAKYGEPGRNMPYMIDRATQTVKVLVDRAGAGTYESVAFSGLSGF